MSLLCDASLGPIFFAKIFLPAFKSGFDPESFRRCAGYLLLDISTFLSVMFTSAVFPNLFNLEEIQNKLNKSL